MALDTPPVVSPFLESLFQRGHDLEPFAIESLRQKLGVPIDGNAGFWRNTRYPYFGASPDGMGENFVVEAKAPLSTAIDKKKFGKFSIQAAFQMMVCNKPFAWVVVYHETETPVAWHLARNPILEQLIRDEYKVFRKMCETRTTSRRVRNETYEKWEDVEFGKWKNGASFLRLTHPQLMPTCTVCGAEKVEGVTSQGPNQGKRFLKCPKNHDKQWEPIDKFVRTNAYAKSGTSWKRDADADADAESQPAAKRTVIDDDTSAQLFMALAEIKDELKAVKAAVGNLHPATGQPATQ